MTGVILIACSKCNNHVRDMDELDMTTRAKPETVTTKSHPI